MYKITKEQLRKIIGANIRKLREDRNISIEELSAMLDLTPGFIGLIERGQRGTTSICLYNVAAVFGESIDNLYEINIDDNDKSAEIDQEKALRQKVASIIFDFNKDELDYLIDSALGLRKLRGKDLHNY